MKRVAPTTAPFRRSHHGIANALSAGLLAHLGWLERARLELVSYAFSDNLIRRSERDILRGETTPEKALALVEDVLADVSVHTPGSHTPLTALLGPVTNLNTFDRNLVLRLIMRGATFGEGEAATDAMRHAAIFLDKDFCQIIDMPRPHPELVKFSTFALLYAAMAKDSDLAQKVLRGVSQLDLHQIYINNVAYTCMVHSAKEVFKLLLDAGVFDYEPDCKSLFKSRTIATEAAYNNEYEILGLIIERLPHYAWREDSHGRRPLSYMSYIDVEQGLPGVYYHIAQIVYRHTIQNLRNYQESSGVICAEELRVLQRCVCWAREDLEM